MDQSTPQKPAETPEKITPDNVAENKTENTVVEPVKDEEGQKADWQMLQEGYLTSPVFYEVANYFGIEQVDYTTAKDKLSEIVDYVVNAKNSPKIQDILVGIRELEDQIQPPAWGEKRYANLYRYIRLAGRKRAVEQAMSAFEKKES